MAYYVKGFDTVQRNLKDLQTNFARKATRTVLRNVIKYLKAQLLTQVPSITGYLRSCFKVKAGRRRKHSISMNVVITKTGEKWYASFFEWGTKKKKRKEPLTHEFETDTPEMEKRIMEGFTEELSKYRGL